MGPAMQTLTEMPESFAAGTTVEYTRSLADFPANDGWTLKVYLRGDGTANATVTPSGADYLVEFPAATTAPLAAGPYEWFEEATKSGKVKSAGSGSVIVTPNIAAAGAGDLLSDAEKTLAALRAKRDGRLTADQEMIQVDNMAITRIPFELLEDLITRYQKIVNAQRRGSAMKVTPIAWSRFR